MVGLILGAALNLIKKMLNDIIVTRLVITRVSVPDRKRVSSSNVVNVVKNTNNSNIVLAVSDFSSHFGDN